MNELFVIIAAILPGVILGIYIWRKDPQPEPTLLLVKAVAFGALACIPVAVVEFIMQNVLFGEGNSPQTLFGSTIDAFFVAALPEESFKLLALWLILRKNRYFDEHIDGIVYAVCVGLGFATVENTMYLFANMDDWQSVACFRALFAVPGHYAFAVLMGYYYSIYHFVNHTKTNRIKILLIPVLAHGIYDAIIMSVVVEPSIWFICIFGLIWFCYKVHRYARDRVIEQVKRGLEA